jgi:hypothetical protein
LFECLSRDSFQSWEKGRKYMMCRGTMRALQCLVRFVRTVVCSVIPDFTSKIDQSDVDVMLALPRIFVLVLLLKVILEIHYSIFLALFADRFSSVVTKSRDV